MVEQVRSKSDPRWGQEDRDRKAEAILATLELHCAQSYTNSVWLDIGCGSGGVAATLAERVSSVIGVDPEPWDRWQDFREKHSNLNFHAGSYLDLETLLGEESVDVVVCNQVYEHVDDPAALLIAIRRVLKPNGVCYFAGPNLLWPIEPHVFWPFVHWLPRRFAIGLMQFFRAKRVGYLDAWSKHYWALKALFRSAGFDVSNAIQDRLAVRLRGANRAIEQVVERIPRSVISVFTPLTPGFVFVLTKSSACNRDE